MKYEVEIYNDKMMLSVVTELETRPLFCKQVKLNLASRP